MTKNKEAAPPTGRGQRPHDSPKYITFGSLIADGYLTKLSRNRQPKRGWLKGRPK
jgi:hypothetical protein